MRCPFCRHDDTQVVDSRVSEDGAAIRRRRRCPACDKRFTTYERVELALPSVVKKDGSRTEFDRRKIVASMQLALRKRPVAADAIDAAVAEYLKRAKPSTDAMFEHLFAALPPHLREQRAIARKYSAKPGGH